MWIGEWNRSVILTYIGMAFSVLGICQAVLGNVVYGFSCLMAAGVCDLFDGAVARKCKRNEAQKLFGVQLDSLVDVMSFLALPVCLCLRIGMNRWYHILILAVFCICGIARLAFFNVTSEGGEEPVKYYRGLPVTYTALILPVVYLLSLALPKGVFLTVYSVVVAAVAGLNILDIRVPKPKGAACLFFALLAAGMLSLFLLVLA